MTKAREVDRRRYWYLIRAPQTLMMVQASSVSGAKIEGLRLVGLANKPYIADRWEIAMATSEEVIQHSRLCRIYRESVEEQPKRKASVEMRGMF